MPTDLTTMTTLDLLRELAARGGMPAGYRLDESMVCGTGLRGPQRKPGYRSPLAAATSGTIAEPTLMWLDEFHWRFPLDLQNHLAGMGVVVHECPIPPAAEDGYGQYFQKEPGFQAHAVEWVASRVHCVLRADDKSMRFGVALAVHTFKPHRGGPGVEGLLRAAVGALREVQGE